MILFWGIAVLPVSIQDIQPNKPKLEFSGFFFVCMECLWVICFWWGFLSRFLWNISFRKNALCNYYCFSSNLNAFFLCAKFSSLWVINKPIKKMRYLWAITKNNIFLLCKMDYKGQQIPIFFIFGRFTQILLFILIWHHFISLNW